ncbi:MAG: substrate-binding domain-containing protein [Nitrospirae bacterium]|nr:substrate-binding domain-containing protein [Nitrospirota bacterium]
MNRLKLSLILLTITFLTVVLAYAEPPSKQSSSNSNLECSDHSYVMSMQKEWINKPIKYEKWAEGADIAIVLDQHLYLALLPMIQKYAKDNKLKIEVREGTCGIAMGAINNKTIDIAGLCCPPANYDRLPGLRYQTLGIAALAILINEQNPVNNVTTDQAKGLFNGKIKKWSELNKGADSEVQPIGRLHCKTRPGHWRLILPTDNDFSLNLKEVGAIPDMVTEVSQDKSAVGFETVWSAKYYADRGKIKILAINGYNPENGTSNLLSSGYPFYEVYDLTTWEGKIERNAKAQKLVEYILANAENIDKHYLILPAKYLKNAGWEFKDNEFLYKNLGTANQHEGATPAIHQR